MGHLDDVSEKGTPRGRVYAWVQFYALYRVDQAAVPSASRAACPPCVPYRVRAYRLSPGRARHIRHLCSDAPRTLHADD